MMPRLSIIPLIWFLLVAPAKAATPLDYTRMILEQAHAIVAGSQTHNEKVAALSVLFSKYLDTDAMAREALGGHWSSFTPAQQKQFLPLFRQLIERAYVQDLLLFQSPDFVYVRQQLLEAGAVVDTQIVTPRDKFDIRYSLISAGDRWIVSAITVEGVSLVGNYGNQFNRVLSRMTPDDLIALMRRKFGNPSGETQT